MGREFELKKRYIAAGILVLVVGWLQYPGFVYTDYEVHDADVKRDDLVVVVTAPGTVKPVTTIEVSSQLSGQIAEVLVDFNEVVRKGQVLARLDAASLQMTVQQSEAELQSAEAQLLLAQESAKKAESELQNARAFKEVVGARLTGAQALEANARRRLDRSESLRSTNSASASEVEETRGEWVARQAAVREQEAQVEVQDAAIASAVAETEIAKARVNAANARVLEAQASLARTRIELSHTEILAPIDGIVILRNVSQGQTVAASLQAPVLFTVAQNLKSIELEVAVDEADVGRIELGQYAVFSVDAYPGEVFRGRVKQIRKAPQRIQSVITYSIVIAADNPEEQLLPGMTALVRIAVESSDATLIVPNAALRFEPPEELASSKRPDSGHVLWRDDDGDLEPVGVRTGIADSESTEVLDGVAEGDRVATGVTVLGRYLNIVGLHFELDSE